MNNRLFLAMQAFDELLLLKRGGQTIYCGPLGDQSSHLVTYFQVLDGGIPWPQAWFQSSQYILTTFHVFAHHFAGHQGGASSHEEGRG